LESTRSVRFSFVIRACDKIYSQQNLLLCSATRHQLRPVPSQHRHVGNQQRCG